MSVKTTLVMLHGWGSSALVWDQLVSSLPAEIEILHPELPGHGSSRLLPGSLPDVSQQIAIQVNNQANGAVWFLGWSLGALIAMYIAMRSLCRVSGLLLVAATPCFIQRAGWSSAMPAAEMASFARDFERQPDKTLKRFHALQAKQDNQVKDVIRQLRLVQTNADQKMRWGLEVLKDSDLRDSLAIIQVPVYLLHGRHDALVPVSVVQPFGAMMKATSKEIWDGTGHAPFLSQPDRFAHWVREKIL